MAIVTGKISSEMVRCFAGIIDFYVVKGQTRARAWPRRLDRQQTPAEQASAKFFGIASASTALLSQEVIDNWKTLAQNTIYTWRDLYIRAYITAERTTARYNKDCNDASARFYG